MECGARQPQACTSSRCLLSGSRFFNHALNGAASYTALVILLRLAGKRTLSQLNVFDFVVTVALGSILASVLLDSTISFTEGITALALLGGPAVQRGLHLIPVAQHPHYHHR